MNRDERNRERLIEIQQIALCAEKELDGPNKTEDLLWEEALVWLRRGHWLTRKTLEIVGLHIQAESALDTIWLVRTIDSKMGPYYQPTGVDRSSKWRVIRSGGE